MRKQLCACGCGDRVTRKVELQHMSGLAPVVLASQVLDQNRRLIRRKQRSQAIGFPAFSHQRLAMEDDVDIVNMDLDDDDAVLPDAPDEDFYMGHPGPSVVMMEDLDGADGQLKLHRSGQKVYKNIYVDHAAGPSDLTGTCDNSLLPDPPHEDFFMDDPAPSPFPDDDASMGSGGNINSEVYGLSNLRRSRRIADGVEKIGQQRWGSIANAPVHFVDNREESDEEEKKEDIDDDESISDFNVASDEEDQEDEDDMFAGPGQEGISLWDSLGEGFLREVSQLGIYFILKFFFEIFLTTVLEGKLLDEADLTLIRAYSLKVNHGLTNDAYNSLRFLFPQAPLDTLKNTEKRIQFLSGFQPVRYHCCPSSCVCYTGPYETLSTCPKCKADRYKSDGKTPQTYFQYLPLIPRLRAMVSNSSYAKKMQYRSKHQHDPTKITDIFDGAHYRSLLETPVTISDEELPMWFFSDPRDVALGFSTDGFGPFKRRNKTAWPLIIFNYNIPPKERFRKEHIISLGTIPGPKKPADMDSFLWPLVQELLQLEIGVSAFDPIAQVIFWFHFYFLIFN